ncbi:MULTISPECIES: hypothetical protein [Volucribacter]|uniref:Holin family HP1 protein n=2 Tax=Volucribacter TaxID=256730 RepID=A0A4R1FRJ1_9PAST|nr:MULTISPECIES: hypothetical protein [Volucribacter]MDG6894537.1 hypothetical protein [Volucribacter amazonae]TCJ96164.1 hypothetical protein EV694_1716 [Volucribacter psittacicida]
MFKDAGNQSYFWSGFGAFWAMYSFEEKLALASLCVGVVTALVNAYAKWQEGKRQKELHDLKVQQLKRGLRNENQSEEN